MVLHLYLHSAKDVALFVRICTHYDCDIIASFEHQEYDCRSMIGMINCVGKDIKILFNCSDERINKLFKDEIALLVKEK